LKRFVNVASGLEDGWPVGVSGCACEQGKRSEGFFSQVSDVNSTSTRTLPLNCASSVRHDLGAVKKAAGQKNAERGNDPQPHGLLRNARRCARLQTPTAAVPAI
jgi:hypothetical protein